MVVTVTDTSVELDQGFSALSADACVAGVRAGTNFSSISHTPL